MCSISLPSSSTLLGNLSGLKVLPFLFQTLMADQDFFKPIRLPLSNLVWVGQLMNVELPYPEIILGTTQVSSPRSSDILLTRIILVPNLGLPVVDHAKDVGSSCRTYKGCRLDSSYIEGSINIPFHVYVYVRITRNQ